MADTVDNAPDSPHSIPVYGIGYRAGPNTWALTGNMPWPLSGHTATLLHTGHVLVLGGGVAMDASAAAQLYDPRTGRWVATGSMRFPRDDPALALLPNGQVLVAGSHDFCGSHARFCPSLSSAELYDPDTGTWTATGDMTTGRAGATATVLPDGRVLVAGGVDGSNSDPGCGVCRDGQPLASAELYDSRHGTWTATGAMTTARSGHTATLLPSGRVLVSGGQDSKGTERASAELYDPRTGRWTATGARLSPRCGLGWAAARSGLAVAPWRRRHVSRVCRASGCASPHFAGFALSRF